MIDTLKSFALEAISDIAKKYDVRSLCDIGCGGAFLLSELRSIVSSDVQLTGIDFKTQLPNEETRLRLKPITFVGRETDDFQALYSKKLRKSEGFNLIVSTMALHHFRYPLSELGTIAKLTKPGGYVWIYDFSFQIKSETDFLRASLSLMDEAFANLIGEFHRHHFTLAEALDLIKEETWEIIEAKEFRLMLEKDEAADESQRMLQTCKKKLSRFYEIEDERARAWLQKSFEYLETRLGQFPIDFIPVFSLLLKKRSSLTDNI